MQYFEIHVVEDDRDNSGFSTYFMSDELKIKNYSYAHLDEITMAEELDGYDFPTSAIDFARRISKKEYYELTGDFD